MDIVRTPDTSIVRRFWLVIRKYRGRGDEVVSVADLRRPKRVILIAEK